MISRGDFCDDFDFASEQICFWSGSPYIFVVIGVVLLLQASFFSFFTPYKSSKSTFLRRDESFIS